MTERLVFNHNQVADYCMMLSLDRPAHVQNWIRNQLQNSILNSDKALRVMYDSWRTHPLAAMYFAHVGPRAESDVCSKFHWVHRAELKHWQEAELDQNKELWYVPSSAIEAQSLDNVAMIVWLENNEPVGPIEDSVQAVQVKMKRQLEQLKQEAHERRVYEQQFSLVTVECLKETDWTLSSIEGAAARKLEGEKLNNAANRIKVPGSTFLYSLRLRQEHQVTLEVVPTLNGINVYNEWGANDAKPTKIQRYMLDQIYAELKWNRGKKQGRNLDDEDEDEPGVCYDNDLPSKKAPKTRKVDE